MIRPERTEILTVALKLNPAEDDPKSVLLVLEVTDMDKLGAIINDPKVQEAKDRHTVKDPLTFSVQVAV